MKLILPVSRFGIGYDNTLITPIIQGIRCVTPLWLYPEFRGNSTRWVSR